MLFWMIVLLAAWIVLVALASYLAETKGYSHLGFGLLEALLGIVGFFVLNILGLFIFEICGLIIVLCLPRRTDNKIDNIDLLLKYKELLDSGIISQDEFESKKQELMNK
ncbi:SHOCT domain-containing protein [Enorma massiliensis]|uniref:SHOCT domain-containing protein n=1 Tax=Enorma massiliensis TaxID=1472761 RepID=UPI003209B310